MRRIIKLVFCGTIFLIGCAFAGFTNELVKTALTEFDRVVLISGFLIGNFAVIKWIGGLSIWIDSGSDVVE